MGAIENEGYRKQKIYKKGEDKRINYIDKSKIRKNIFTFFCVCCFHDRRVK